MDFVPCEGHRTPALRPGIGCLLVARSGRHAPLEISGKWVSALGRLGCLIQCSAAAAGGHDGKADKIFVPAPEAQVQTAIPANAEQLVTARTAPFFQMMGGDLIWVRNLAPGDGSRHWNAPLIE